MEKGRLFTARILDDNSESRYDVGRRGKIRERTLEQRSNQDKPVVIKGARYEVLNNLFIRIQL